MQNGLRIGLRFKNYHNFFKWLWFIYFWKCLDSPGFSYSSGPWKALFFTFLVCALLGLVGFILYKYREKLTGWKILKMWFSGGFCFMHLMCWYFWSILQERNQLKKVSNKLIYSWIWLTLSDTVLLGEQACFWEDFLILLKKSMFLCQSMLERIKM